MIYLGLDSGTQSTKCIALDLDSGQILAASSQTYGLLPGLPAGHMEQNPDTWVEAADASVRAVLAQLGDRRREVRAIGVSGQQHGLVALNDDNQPVRPAKLWNDTSTTAQCEAITKEFGGEDEIIAMIGNAMLPATRPRKSSGSSKTSRPTSARPAAFSCRTISSTSGSPARNAWNTATPRARRCST